MKYVNVHKTENLGSIVVFKDCSMSQTFEPNINHLKFSQSTHYLTNCALSVNFCMIQEMGMFVS